jgi:ubiquinone/menaquinone biosynthesis C-methylase UbiE
MGFYGDHVLPRLIDFGLNNRHVNAERAKALALVRGDVLEIGFGSGLNLPYYSQSVQRVVGLDPSEVGWKLARKRMAASSIPVEHLVLSSETIPAADASFDSVVSTFTLCTIPDVERALFEVKRVLRSGGRFFFLEHGRSSEPRIQRWQDRWDPMQGRLFGGCHVNRPIDHLVARAGLRIDELETYYSRGPRIFSFFYRGVAARAGAS